MRLQLICSNEEFQKNFPVLSWFDTPDGGPSLQEKGNLEKVERERKEMK